MSDSSLHGLPGWIMAETIADKRATFESSYGRPLTDIEVIEILLNVGHPPLYSSFTVQLISIAMQPVIN